MPITHSVMETNYLITDGKYSIRCDITTSGIGVYTDEGKAFIFVDSKPETVKAIGELISYAAGLGR